jgi:DNA invertase Pin-like site-specific DNA recombinase
VQVSGTNDQLIPSPPCGASSLTPRQTEVLQLAARGLSRKKIARLLGISVRTVEDHFSAMRQRAGAHSESELIAYAVMAGLVTSGDAAAVRWPRARPQPASEPLCVTPASATTSETSGHMRGVHFSRVGLARITVDAHNAQLEYDALTEAGCGRIFKEQTNAGKIDCPGVAAALDHLRQGDIFVVWKLHSLGRSVKEVLSIVLGIHQRGASVEILTGTLAGTYTLAGEGRFFFTMAAALAELERDIIYKRKEAGPDAGRDVPEGDPRS